MTLGAADLVLCSGTLRREASFAERIEAAVAGGFTGISLWARDYSSARRSGLSDADLRTMLADHGLGIAEVDLVWSWLPGAADVHIPEELDSEELFAYGEGDVLRIAEAVGARSINAIDVFGGDWTIDDAAAAFAGLCDRAAGHGLLVHVEFLPWSRIPDLPTALRVVRSADRPNGGVLVDAWHYFRSGADAATLREAPGDRILGVQLSDGPFASEDNLPMAALHDRLLPGAGNLDLVGFVRTLREIAAPAPFGVEVFSDDLATVDTVEVGRRAGAAVRRVLAGY